VSGDGMGKLKTLAQFGARALGDLTVPPDVVQK
jgi:hypothetical protein